MIAESLPPLLADALVVAGAAAVLFAVVVGIAAAAGRDRTLDWAVRYVCPGCDRRYQPWRGDPFFLRFRICPGCGTDKGEFRRSDCMREADGTWVDRADLEAVARELTT